MRIKTIIILGLILLSSTVLAQPSPRLYFYTYADSFGIGSELTINVFIDSHRALNAYEVEIGYSPNILEFTHFNTVNSIVDFWKIEPKIIEPGVVRLQGGGSVPFAGGGGELIKIHFRAKKEGLAQLSFRKAEVYYADGIGTKAQVSFKPISFSVVSYLNATSDFTEDKKPPIISEVSVNKSPVDKNKILSFRIRDDNSGTRLAYARIKKRLFWDEWQITQSPMQITKNVWAIQIKAVDNQGNIAQKTNYIWQEIFDKFFIFILSTIAMLTLLYFARIKTRVQK